ncbi:polysaccharide lyase family 7 protein [Haloferula sp.]|uniref:polysaccharide lyase family 7 protein n=1 Tax=Haloferula sp. TaxID=2497595 RepID=UPI003C73C770
MKKPYFTLLLSLCLWCNQVCADEPKPPSEVFDLTHWKLTLPVNASGAAEGKATEIQAAELADGYTNTGYFYSDKKGAMVFWCPVNGATTEGSKYCRTELREVIDPNDDDVCWPASGTHILDARCRVSAVPSSKKVIIGQIHSYSGKAKPLIKLQFFKNRVEALVKESPNKDKDLKLTFADVGLGNDFDYQIKLDNGLLSISVNDEVQSVNVYESDPQWADQWFYFKAGSYVQDTDGPATEGGRVSFTKLMAAHSKPSTENPKE